LPPIDRGAEAVRPSRSPSFFERSCNNADARPGSKIRCRAAYSPRQRGHRKAARRTRRPDRRPAPSRSPPWRCLMGRWVGRAAGPVARDRCGAAFLVPGLSVRWAAGPAISRDVCSLGDAGIVRQPRCRSLTCVKSVRLVEQHDRRHSAPGRSAPSWWIDGRVLPTSRDSCRSISRPYSKRHAVDPHQRSSLADSSSSPRIRTHTVGASHSRRRRRGEIPCEVPS
jgi:hypothetical protein